MGSRGKWVLRPLAIHHSTTDQKNVGGLQISMNDAALVGIVNCSSELLDKRHGYRSRPRLAELVRQASTFHQLQREEGQPVDFPDFKDLHNIGMLQSSDSVCFRAKARRLFRQAA